MPAIRLTCDGEGGDKGGLSDTGETGAASLEGQCGESVSLIVSVGMYSEQDDFSVSVIVENVILASGSS